MFIKMLLLCPLLPLPPILFLLALHVSLHCGYSKGARRPCLRKAGGISMGPCLSLPLSLCIWDTSTQHTSRCGSSVPWSCHRPLTDLASLTDAKGRRIGGCSNCPSEAVSRPGVTGPLPSTLGRLSAYISSWTHWRSEVRWHGLLGPTRGTSHCIPHSQGLG